MKAPKQTRKRYTDEEKSKMLNMWDEAQGTHAVRFDTMQKAGYAGSLNGWLQNVKSWRGKKKARAAQADTASSPAAESKQKRPALKRGRVGPDERAKIADAHKSGTDINDIAAQYSRSAKVIQAILNPGNSSGSSKSKKGAVAVSKKEMDAIEAIPASLKDEFIAFMLSKVFADHKHKIKDTANGESAVRSYMKIQEIQKALSEETERLKTF